MRRKGRKVIKPAGSELIDYLNKGYAICNKCGAVMDRKEDPEEADAVFMPARPVDGKLRNWIMSTRAQTKWNSDSMKEATSI